MWWCRILQRSGSRGRGDLCVRVLARPGMRSETLSPKQKTKPKDFESRIDQTRSGTTEGNKGLLLKKSGRKVLSLWRNLSSGFKWPLKNSGPQSFFFCPFLLSYTLCITVALQRLSVRPPGANWIFLYRVPPKHLHCPEKAARDLAHVRAVLSFKKGMWPGSSVKVRILVQKTGRSKCLKKQIKNRLEQTRHKAKARQ